MKKQEFCLKSTNAHFNRVFANQELNFCKMLVQSYDENLSVTARYHSPNSWAVLRKDFSTKIILDDEHKNNTFYYGVAPHLDSRELIQNISKLQFQTAEGIDNYISSHSEWFMLHSNQRDFLPAFARYIIIVMASHFGIELNMTKDQWTKFFAQIEAKYKQLNYDYETLKIFFVYSEKEERLLICGCPTKELLECLDEFKYIKDDEHIDAWTLANQSFSGSHSIKEVYNSGVKLVKGRVFYSGVLLKPIQFEMLNESYENDQIKSICIHFERSTYGTVCTLDSNFMDHPLLKRVKPQILKMLSEDDDCKRALADSLGQLEREGTPDNACIISLINNYLKNCFNVNQIGVSANIVTCDGYVLLGSRNNNAIDEGKLYPGVNGNAELADRNVSFYGNSVYDDYPTIRVDDDRIDFLGEIGREAYGELKINLPRQEWTCYGIVLLGNIPSKNDNTMDLKRRFHFNIIFEHSSEKTFLDIEKHSRKATEAFETKDYVGVSLTCERNRCIHIIKAIWEFITQIVTHKDVIEASLAMVIFLPMLRHTLLSDTINKRALFSVIFGNGWAEGITFFLSLGVVIVSLLKILKNIYLIIKRNLKTKRVYFYKGMSYTDINTKVMKLFKPGRYHPAAYAALRSYIDNRVFDVFFTKDRRKK